MSLRDLALVGLMFTFIFGWKITAQLDLILISSAALYFWVFMLADTRMGRYERMISVALLGLSFYSLMVSLLTGAVDIQVALRSIRALVNFVGGVALATLYVSVYRQRAAAYLGLGVYLSVLVHALLICVMFMSEGLRLAIYSLVSTYDYVNVNASILLGLRISGLTYGLASTSIVQLAGVLLVPLVLREFAASSAARFWVWMSMVPLVVSLFLTGRTGLLLAVVFLPLLIFGSGSGGRSRGWGKAILPLTVVVGGVAFMLVRYGEALQETFSYSLKHAGELLELVESGSTDTTSAIAGMYFLPEDPVTLLFGSSNLGRGDLAYIESDVGFVKLIFAVGIFGVLLHLIPYALGIYLSVRCYTATKAQALALAAALALLAGIVLNFKELALLTRNQWSIQSLLIAACALELVGRVQQRAALPARIGISHA